MEVFRENIRGKITVLLKYFFFFHFCIFLFIFLGSSNIKGSSWNSLQRCKLPMIIYYYFHFRIVVRIPLSEVFRNYCRFALSFYTVPMWEITASIILHKIFYSFNACMHALEKWSNSRRNFVLKTLILYVISVNYFLNFSYNKDFPKLKVVVDMFLYTKTTIKYTRMSGNIVCSYTVCIATRYYTFFFHSIAWIQLIITCLKRWLQPK